MKHVIAAENHHKKHHHQKNHHQQRENHPQQQTEKVRSTLPPKDSRTKPVAAYKPTSKAAYRYDDVNLTMERFLDDSYTIRYYKKCGLNYDIFNKKYLSSSLALDYCYNYLSDQLETMAFIPWELCGILNQTYGSTAFGKSPDKQAEWMNEDESYWSWKYVKMVANIALKEWNRYSKSETKEWKELENEEMLWLYFKKWFLWNLLGSIFVQRAKKVKMKFGFSKNQAKSTAERPHYETYSPEKVNKALYTLHKWEKIAALEQKKNSAAHLSTIDERKSNDDFKDFNHSASDNLPSNQGSRSGSSMKMTTRRTRGGYGNGGHNNQNDNNDENNYNDRNNDDYFKRGSHSAIDNHLPHNSRAESVVSAPSMIMTRRRTRDGYGNGGCNNQNDNNDENVYNCQNNGEYFKRGSCSAIQPPDDSRAGSVYAASDSPSIIMVPRETRRGYDNDHETAPYVEPSSNLPPIPSTEQAAPITQYDYSSESDDDDDPQDTGNDENDENNENEDSSSDMDLTEIGFQVISGV